MSVPCAAAVPRTRRSWRGRAAAFALPILATLLAGCEAGGSYPQTTFRPVSEFGDRLNAVFYNTFWWTMIILIIVVALILYAAFRFRDRPGAPHPAQIHGNTKLEITWTVIPALIVVAIGIPTVTTVFDTQRRPPDDALVVEVTGRQWWWQFHYPQLGVTTANLLYLPTDRPISLVMSSADVVHSFWVPKIGGKRDVNPLPRRRDDATPALPNYLTFTVRDPGFYPGACAEFCGEAHAIMRMGVQAVPAPEFDAWVQRMLDPQSAASFEVPPPAALPTIDAAEPTDTAAEPQPAPAPRIGEMPMPTGAGNPFVAPVPESVLLEEGRRIFLGSPCVACHAIAHTTARGSLGPDLTLFGTRPMLGAGAAENDRDNLVQWIRDPQAMKPGALMPGTTRGAAGMAPTGLSDAEVRAVAAYLSSLR